MRKGKAKMPKGKRIRKGRKKVEREDKEKASKSTLEGGILLYLKGEVIGSRLLFYTFLIFELRRSVVLLYQNLFFLDIRTETR